MVHVLPSLQYLIIFESLTKHQIIALLQAFQDYDRSKKKSWFDARDHCRALGGDLLSLHAQNIDDASLTAMFRCVKHPATLGLVTARSLCLVGH